jgi:hypothetical protein
VVVEVAIVFGAGFTRCTRTCHKLEDEYRSVRAESSDLPSKTPPEESEKERLPIVAGDGM